MANETKRVPILCAFGDIVGFTAFAESIDDDDTEIVPFLDAYDRILDELVPLLNRKPKDLGDGFVLFIEMDPKANGADVIDLIEKLWLFLDKITRTIREWKNPRPDGYRIRITFGFAIKKKRRGHWDFLGRCVNKAHELLEIEKGVPFMIHEKVKQLFTEADARKRGFVVRPLLANGPSKRSTDRHRADLYVVERAKGRK